VFTNTSTNEIIRFMKTYGKSTNKSYSKIIIADNLHKIITVLGVYKTYCLSIHLVLYCIM